MTFDDGKDGVLLLPMAKGFAEMPEELAARGFKQVEIAPIIDMIADGTLGIGDTVREFELWHGRSLWFKTKGLKSKVAG
jgi:hypothetical protein